MFINILNSSYNSNSQAKNIDDYGVITLMYHRFDENKYPSTNIRMEDFIKQINMIKSEKITFVNPNNFEESLKNFNQKKALITIDDGFSSFYKKAWPFLQKNKIPFILFVSTREVGKNGYMTWGEIKEIHESDIGFIGNHSHSHEYLVDDKYDLIKNDLSKSISIFKSELGSNSPFFSYPFGEYSNDFKKIVNELDFKYAFGQHSGVIFKSKNMLELPRFPINEKYGKLDRFKTILKTLPFKYKSIKPEERYISEKNNPPKVLIEFDENTNNLNLINCFSNEENKWRNSIINFIEENKLEIKLQGKFVTERGRINCSLREENGYYRWLGLQFVVAEIN